MYVFPGAEDEDSPWPIYERILKTHDELRTLRELTAGGINLAFALRAGEWTKPGRTILGMCYMPRVQGDLQGLFAQLLEDTLGYWPDFLIVLSLDWWEEATPEKREILLFHELLHCGWAKDRHGVERWSPDGVPVPCLNPHDLEEFNAVVERYGSWSPDVTRFLAAAKVGEGRAPQGAAEAPQEAPHAARVVRRS